MFIESSECHRNRKQRFLEKMEEILPWETLLAICKEKWQITKLGRPKYELELQLKIYFLQQWYNLGDPTVENEIYDSIAFRKFLGINDFGDGIPDETTILRFRRFLEKHELTCQFFEKTSKELEEQGHIIKRGTIVDATIVTASSSTKNKDKKRDKEMSSTRKNNNYYFGMKQHIGVDADKGMIHTIESTTAKTHDIDMLESCLHGEERFISGDKAYGTIARKQQMRSEGKTYHITDKKIKRRKPKGITKEKWDKIKKIPVKLSNKQKKRNRQISSIRSKVEHPFRVIKHLWGHRNVRYKGIDKNNLQWNALAMLCNFYMLSTCKRFSSS